MMSKKKKRGHYCRICHTYRANEKFSGKGHARHICKSCQKELRQQKRVKKKANKKALAAGLRPPKYDYPKTAKQAASYLRISEEEFVSRCQQLDIQPCQMDDDMPGSLPVYDIDAMIAVHRFDASDTNTDEAKESDAS
jgi:hypothetical protein